jgi:tetratricopeptide (TPR) repeat protein
MPLKKSSFQNLGLFLLSLVFIELLLRTSGAAITYLEKRSNQSHLEKLDENRILCIGESTTAWGLGNSYPSQLQVALDAKFGAGKYSVINEGVSGTSTKIILERLPSLLDKYKPKIVISMMGINDFWMISGEETYIGFLSPIRDFFLDMRIVKIFRLAAVNLKYSAKAVPSPSPSPPPAKLVTVGDYTEAARLAEKDKELKRARELFETASKMSMFDPHFLFNLGMVDSEIGDTNAAKITFYKYARFFHTAKAYFDVGAFYYFRYGVFDKGGFKNAFEFLYKSLEIDPNYADTLGLLGVGYAMTDQNRTINRKKAVPYLLHQIELGPPNPDVYNCLGAIYTAEGRFAEAEQTLLTGAHITHGDSNYFVWEQLIQFYIQRHELDKALKTLDEADVRFPGNGKLLQIRHENLANPGKATINLMNFLEFKPTQRNYRSFMALVQESGATSVVMQYPRRDIEPLKNILSGFSGILFVPNQTAFEEALKTHTYEDLFVDKFGLNFGHFTLVGSLLIVNQLVSELSRAGLLK